MGPPTYIYVGPVNCRMQMFAGCKPAAVLNAPRINYDAAQDYSSQFKPRVYGNHTTRHVFVRDSLEARLADLRRPCLLRRRGSIQKERCVSFGCCTFQSVPGAHTDRLQCMTLASSVVDRVSCPPTLPTQIQNHVPCSMVCSLHVHILVFVCPGSLKLLPSILSILPPNTHTHTRTHTHSSVCVPPDLEIAGSTQPDMHNYQHRQQQVLQCAV